MTTEEIARALRGARIEFSKEELEEVAQSYGVLKDGLDEAFVKLKLAETEPDFIRDSVPA